MNASHSTYSSVRRSLHPSFSTAAVGENVSLRPKPSEGSLDLLTLLRILSFHNAKHISIPLMAGFHRGTPLGRGASFNVKEWPLPKDRAGYHLQIRDQIGSDEGRSLFEDVTNERWAAGTKGAYKLVSSTIYSELIRELRVLYHPALRDFVVRLAGLAWVAGPIPRGENVPQERPVIIVERAPHGSLHDFMQSKDWTSGQVSLKAKFRICVRVLRCITVGTPKRRPTITAFVD